MSGPNSATAPPRGPAVGLVLGGLLVLAGVGWLLDSLDVVDLSLAVLLAGALIVVGLALLVVPGAGGNTGLIVGGALLTLGLVGASAFDVDLKGGIGDRSFRPVSLRALQDEYHLAVGELTVDLSQLPPPRGVVRVVATVGVGQLVIRVPVDVEVMAGGRVGLGQLRLLDEWRDGFGLEAETVRRFGPRRVPGGVLHLEASVGVGELTVEAG